MFGRTSCLSWIGGWIELSVVASEVKSLVFDAFEFFSLLTAVGGASMRPRDLTTPEALSFLPGLIPPRDFFLGSLFTTHHSVVCYPKGLLFTSPYTGIEVMKFERRCTLVLRCDVMVAILIYFNLFYFMVAGVSFTRRVS